ncbi:hypothetical protein SH591_05040 [Sphingomonas sp. LY54]|uniref:hypothetical protein n=1 Tax=Sphingomonas sp. LY54 TaxID=3095343 RepID=UPI002D76B8F6|nr:hypothetical protein [Sphingomonas sp. LY54]WRP29547.1 hypothetical protein SH591_05040 [Sphingomonas sp. LY54]
MSDAAQTVRTALVAALQGEPVLDGVAVYGADAPVLPRIEVGEPASADWSSKSWQGRELRTAIVVRVAGGQSERLAAMRAAAEQAGETLGRDLPGWRVASALFLRSRTVEQKGIRALLVEHRIRVMEVA